MSSKPRARKNASAAAAATELAPTLEVVENPPPETMPVKKSRSSKKTPPVVAIVTPSGVQGSFLSEQRPLIAHLPVSSNAIEFESTNLVKPEAQNEMIGDDGPSAFDTHMFSYLDGVEEGVGVQSDVMGSVATPIEEQKVVIPPSYPACKLPTNYSEKLMVLFQDSNRYNKLPEKTEIACFWCCHGFQSLPCAIPSHILDEVWHMYGNFCSPECAAAYLFKERIDTHIHWERYALLNCLYTVDAEIKHGAPRGIRPAPPREVLRMFGGSMDISEYRSIVHEKKLRVDVLKPPMVSIIQTMDTKPIDFYDQNLKNVFISNDLQHKYNAPGAQGLRLRRSKPVKSKESTVEWAMQIQHLAVA